MEVSPGERATGALSPAKLEALAAEFRRDGVVVLRSVIPDDELALLRPRMLSDAAALAARRAQHTGSRSDSGRKGHIWLGPPRAGPWVRPCFVANAIIEQVARVLLGGERVALAAYAGQCALPGSSLIRWHMDGRWEHATAQEAAEAGCPWPSRTTSLHVNFNVLDVHAGNGATEIYRGSHHELGGGDAWKLKKTDPPPELLEQRARHTPPVPNAFPAGACAFRDARVW